MITRRNPPSGYFGEDVYRAFGFTQVVRAGKTVHIAGVAPLRGGLDNMEVIGSGDLRAQITFCFEQLRLQLADEGLGLEHVVAHRMYVTDMAAFRGCGDIMAGLFGDESPAPTLCAVTEL